MLEQIKETQKNAYKIITNAVKNKKISHAYLIETNNYEFKNEFVLEFVKTLLCLNHEFCVNCDCNICKKIDKNIYSEFKIIKPEGLWIKKEQLLELQSEFKYTSVESFRKVYVIENAEKMNSSSANTLLKFLEEPEDNIVAILVSDNIHQLLDTIVSRCQLISLTNKNDNLNINEYEKVKKMLSRNCDNLDQIIADSIDLVYLIEQKGLDAIIYTKEFVNKFSNSSEFELALEIMILFYKDILNYKMNINELFPKKDLELIAKLNDVDKLKYKITKLLESKNNVKINANTNLLLDKFIIDIGCDTNERNSWCSI